MKPLFVLLLAVFAVRAAPAPQTIPLFTIGTRSYRDAEVRRLDAVTARITHAEGIAKVFAWELDESQQRQFGFDPAAVAAERARRVEEFRKKTEDVAQGRKRILIQRLEGILAEFRFYARTPGGKSYAQLKAMNAELHEIEKELARLPLTDKERANVFPPKNSPSAPSPLAKHKMPARDPVPVADRSLIGMTCAEALEKYGQPFPETDGERAIAKDMRADRCLSFDKGGMIVFALLIGDRVEGVIYKRRDGLVLSSAEALALMANHRKGEWMYRPDIPNSDQNWEAPDQSMVAMNATDISALTILSVKFIAEKKRRLAAAMKGL